MVGEDRRGVRELIDEARKLSLLGTRATPPEMAKLLGEMADALEDAYSFLEELRDYIAIGGTAATDDDHGQEDH